MAEEGKRGQMMEIEEEELGFAPDAGGGGEAGETETDEKSEGSDGELCGKDRQDLVADLIGAIDAPAKRGQTNPATNKSYRAPSKKAKPPKSKPKPTEPAVKVGIPPLAKMLEGNTLAHLCRANQVIPALLRLLQYLQSHSSSNSLKL